MATGFDSMGPRIDMSQEHEEPDYGRPAPAPYQIPRSQGGGAGSMLVAVISLVVALLSGGLGLWALMAMPERVPGPMHSADVVPGGTAERVAKLEKDVSQLMLRLVTLEKELEAQRGKAGPVTKLTELSAKVAALQGRLDAMGGGRVAAPVHEPASEEPPAPRAAPAPKAAPRPALAARPEAHSEARPELSPAVKAVAKSIAEEEPGAAQGKKAKNVYTVRRGDTLFSVAMRYKVTREEIMRWNNLKPGDTLKVDQQLTIYK